MHKCLFLLLLIAPAVAEEKVADPKTDFIEKVRYEKAEYKGDLELGP